MCWVSSDVGRPPNRVMKSRRTVCVMCMRAHASVCVIIRHNRQRTISPLPSQRLSAPLIYIQSFLPPLSHVTVISPLSQVEDLCHHLDREQESANWSLSDRVFFIVYVRTLICQLVYSPNNEVYHFLSFYCHSMHNTSYNESVILLSWTWKAINNIFLAILHENQWHLDCFWRPRIT